MSSTPVGMSLTHMTHDSTPAVGTPSELHSARSIRESAVKVLDSPEATRAMELSETLLSRLEEEFLLMESIQAQAQAAGGVDADPIDSWLAKAGEAGAKGIAESRELKIQLASSHLTYLDVESETEDDEDARSPRAGQSSSTDSEGQGEGAGWPPAPRAAPRAWSLSMSMTPTSVTTAASRQRGSGSRRRSTRNTLLCRRARARSWSRPRTAAF